MEVFLLPGLFYLAIAAALIYLIVKRVKEKKKETFEDRDN